MIKTDEESVETNYLALVVTESSPYLHHGFYDILGKHVTLNFACAWLHIHTPHGDDGNNRHNSSTKELHQHWHHRRNVWNLFSALTQSSSGSIYWVNSSRGKNEREREKEVKNVNTPMTMLWESTKRNTCRNIAVKMDKSVDKSNIIWSSRQWKPNITQKGSGPDLTWWAGGEETRERKDREKRPTDKKSWFLQCWNLQPKQQTWFDHLSFFKMYDNKLANQIFVYFAEIH